jgi:hypothetical protein
MRFDKWWNKQKQDDNEEGYVYRLAEAAYMEGYDQGEMANNEGAYDDGYNQGRADMDAEIDLDEVVSKAFLAGHARGHAEGMEASLKELL